ncbi:MAG TPA: rhodanese-like domain-containing protein [Polyangiaceae bacterium]|nr:rhodanese-like domain-containing protein [Polyangiaceae bacterium]
MNLTVRSLFSVPVCVVALGATLPACNEAPSSASPGKASAAANAAAPTRAVREVGVADVARILKDKSGVVVDANGEDTRKEFGVVPGALLLTSHKNFALSELPAEKSTELVFYCGGTQCRASDSAAERASGAGYTNVAVMREGIRGWKSAGQPTNMPQS